MVENAAADVCSADNVFKRVRICGICGKSGLSRVNIGISSSGILDAGRNGVDETELVCP